MKNIFTSPLCHTGHRDTPQLNIYAQNVDKEDLLRSIKSNQTFPFKDVDKNVLLCLKQIIMYYHLFLIVGKMKNKFSKKRFLSILVSDRAHKHTKTKPLSKLLLKISYFVQFHHIKCFVPNCPGAKLTGAKLSWCQIAHLP